MAFNWKIAAVISADIAVKYRQMFNAGILERTREHFLVFVLVKSKGFFSQLESALVNNCV